MAKNLNSSRNAEISSSVSNVNDFEIIKISYLWQTYISDFQPRIFSPVFGSDEYDCCKWKMRSDYKSYAFSLNLQSLKTNPEVKAFHKLTMFNSKDVEIVSIERDKAVHFKPSQWNGYPDFLTNRNQIHLLMEKEIKIRCELVVLIKRVQNVELNEPECKLCENLGSLLDNDKFSDVTLVVGDHTLPAHKTILSLRSIVFAAMFEHEMEERKSGSVVITDVKPEVLKDMLHFMYTGKAPNLAQMAGDLFAAADKYALHKLKDMCEKTLCNQLSKETVIATFILADRHSADQLKKETISFIGTHAAEVMNTQSWKNAIAEHPHLIATELTALLINIKLTK